MAAALIAVWARLLGNHCTGRDVYQFYLRSPGWMLTKAIRKSDHCKRCKSSRRLELHHKRYDWHNRHKIIRWIMPNLFDPMETLCNKDHRKEHGYGKRI